MNTTRMKRVAALAAVCIAVTSLTAHLGSVEAKGPNTTVTSIGVGGGGVIPGVGGAVSLQMGVTVDSGGTAPSESAFVDSIVMTSSGTAATRGPGHSGGGGMPASAVGSTVGSATILVHTGLVSATAFVSALASPHYGAMAQCGDNYGGTFTRDYAGTGVPSGSTLVAGPKAFSLQTASMLGDTTLLPGPLALMGWDGTATELLYAHSGGSLIQSYDDDNDNGIPDFMEGGAAEPVADGAVTPAHPYATDAAGTAYVTGVPETQHDDDADGLPNGLERMPDFAPQLLDALGLRTYWEARLYGVIDFYAGVYPPIDVHVLRFAAVPGTGAMELVITGSPFAPPDPLLQGVYAFCPPMDLSAALSATSTATNLCLILVCAPPPGVTAGDSVTLITSAGGHTTTLAISDQEDYDIDGRASGIELCDRSATNADADNDLVAGVCDLAPASWDNDLDGNATTADRAPSIASLVAGTATCQITGNLVCDNDVDGDRWINNHDNCESVDNPSQADFDDDTVGDACDLWVTTDTYSGLPSGAGPGTSAVTSANIDNDLECTRAWSTGGVLGLAPAPCSDIDDANDDGRDDALSTASDEDGDGWSDAIEDLLGSNALEPASTPPCLVNPAGTPTLTDTDGDHLLDTCEPVLGTTVGDPDTDNDGVKDGMEVGVGTDPLVPGLYDYAQGFCMTGTSSGATFEWRVRYPASTLANSVTSGSSLSVTSGLGSDVFAMTFAADIDPLIELQAVQLSGPFKHCFRVGLLAAPLAGGDFQFELRSPAGSGSWSSIPAGGFSFNPSIKPDGAADTDLDGCPDTREDTASNKHPGNWWDTYSVDDDDTPGYDPNNNVDLSDTLDILGHFGEPYNGGAYATVHGQGYDRRRLLSPGPAGLLVEGNNGIDLSEALANLFQFGLGGGICAAPGPVPAEGGGIY